MKSILPIALLCLLYIFSSATLSNESEYRLWKILNNNGQLNGYLFGTIHLPIIPEELFQHYPNLKVALGQVNRIVTEALSASPIEQLIEQLIEPFDCQSGLNTVFTGQDLVTAINYLQPYTKSLSATNHSLECLQPAFLPVPNLIVDSSIYIDGMTIDYYLSTKAKLKTTPLSYLETTEFIELNLNYKRQHQTQLAQLWLTHFPAYRETNWQDSTLHNYHTLMGCYLRESSCSLVALIEQAEKRPDSQLLVPPRLQIYQFRNLCWITGILEFLEDSFPLFVVGAGHLYGQNSIPELLEYHGYTVSPVPQQSSPFLLDLEMAKRNTEDDESRE